MQACHTEKADLLIHNAKIYTVNDSFDIVEAMAIKDGKIIELGPNNQLKNKYQAEEVIDAKLGAIYPGLIDAHCHFLWYGHGFYQVDLVGSKSWQEVVSRAIKFADSNNDEWIQGRGWDQNDWEVKEFPNKVELDSLFPDRPVLLKRIDGHAAIANQKALDLAGVSIESEISGGVYHAKNGLLTGLLIDNAIDSVSKAIPELTNAQMERALLKAQEMCFEKGLTTVDDAMLENEMVHAIQNAQESGQLKMKVYGMLMPTKENKEEFLKNGPIKTDHLNIRAFKYFADGALGSRGAKLKEEYHDDHDNFGLYLNSKAYLLNEAKELYEHGFQMNTHCIGDEANATMLSIYAEVLEGTNDKRWRIEHAQVVEPSDLNLFQQYTIIPSVQPTHATSDMYWAEERLGPKRVKHAYAYKDLLEQLGMVALGTDFPIEDIDPMKTFYAAVSRKDAEDYPENGFNPENKLSRKEALKGMTIWAAISNFEENEKGSLVEGKQADFIFMNQDIMQVKEEKLLKSKVLKTFINGELVFKN